MLWNVVDVTDYFGFVRFDGFRMGETKDTLRQAQN